MTLFLNTAHISPACWSEAKVRWDLSGCGYALLDGRCGKWGGRGSSRQEGNHPPPGPLMQMLWMATCICPKILGQAERKIQFSVSIPLTPSPFSRPALKVSTDL